MRIIVCVKQIRQTYARTGMDPEQYFLKPEDSVYRINPYDEAALELALQHKRRHKELDSHEIGKGEWDLFDLLSIWKSWYRDLLLTKLHCPADFLINVDFSQKLKNISRHFKIENLIDSFHMVDRSQRDLLQTRNVDIMMEHTVLTLKRLASQENNR